MLYCFYLLYDRLSCLSKYPKSTNTLYFREFREFFVRNRSTASHAFVNNTSYRVFVWDSASVAFSSIFACHNHSLISLKFNCLSRFSKYVLYLSRMNHQYVWPIQLKSMISLLPSAFLLCWH